MTDKQIIIDGVDVSGCINYRPSVDTTQVSYTNACSIGIWQRWYSNLEPSCIMSCSCKDNPNCHYKQLKRKEKSEEKLVKQIQTICDFINNRPETFKSINGSVDKIITDYAERKEQECEKLRFPMKDNNYAILTKEEFENFNQLKKENKQLKQTLAEIKEIAENNKRSVLCFTAFEGDTIEVNNEPMAVILQKINECEVDK